MKFLNIAICESDELSFSKNNELSLSWQMGLKRLDFFGLMFSES
jgi:hypothetical protein